MPRGVSPVDSGRLQGRLWTPAQIPASQLLAWHDFTDLSTLFTTGGLVDSARDKSGNGRTIGNTGTGRPTFGVAALNTRTPGLVFAGAQSLYCGVSWALTAVHGFSVHQHSATSGYVRQIGLNATVGGADYNGGNGIGLLHRGNSFNDFPITYYVADKGSGYPNAAGSRAATPPLVASAVNDGATSTVYTNGRVGTPVAFAPGTISPLELEIGATAHGAGGMVGTISETLVLTGAMPDWLRLKIEGYLFHKHRIQENWVSLNAYWGAHPYWSTPPLIGD